MQESETNTDDCMSTFVLTERLGLYLDLLLATSLYRGRLPIQ
jgi:hypothetical protein